MARGGHAEKAAWFCDIYTDKRDTSEFCSKKLKKHGSLEL
jgi:hypothetical protein